MMTDILLLTLGFMAGIFFGLHTAGNAISRVIKKDIDCFGKFRMGNTVYKAEKQEGWDG